MKNRELELQAEISVFFPELHLCGVLNALLDAKLEKTYNLLSLDQNIRMHLSFKLCRSDLHDTLSSFFTTLPEEVRTLEIRI